MKTHFGFKFLPKTHILVLLISLFINAHSQPDPVDTQVMLSLKKSLNPPSLDWSDPNPCKWAHVVCSDENRVTRIQIGHQNIQGTLPTNLSNLTRLERLELQWNSISGPLPTLNGLNMLQVLMISNNMFTSIPDGFFVGLTSLQAVEMDNNPFTKWVIPESLKDASTLQNFSAVNVNITGKIPGFFGPDVFPGLVNLHLAINDLDGELPSGLSGSQLESFWVNGNRLSGKVDILQNMTFLKEVWLHSNTFSGCLPDLSGLEHLEVLSLRDNSFTGIVPDSLVGLESLKSVNLTNNMFQGPMPKFRDSVSVDMIKGSNNFCLPEPGECDARVNTLLLIAKGMDYSVKFANNWKGNDPCADWIGITCNNDNITIVNFQKMGLTGTISPAFSDLKTLQRIVLANNNLTGTIPEELTTLPSLTQLDLENNNLYGKVPSFKSNLNVNVNGNPDIGKERSSSTDSSSSGTNSTDSNGVSLNGKKKSKNWIGVVLISILGGVFVMFFIGVLAFCLHKKKQKKLSQVQSPHAIVIHPRNSGSDNESVKITVAGSSVSVGALSETHTIPRAEGDNIQMVEAGNMVISIQVLRTVTNNFSKENILGQGGFGTVYKGELHDGTKIAVKRMECGVITGKGLAEFTSEIAVLTKVRHRNLVALLGYCLDGNEKLLVYEYMPQGTLSRYLFNWPEEGLNPLEWTRRLAIALDVARGVEYLHGLAHQSFIHRDLKPSNILLGDDMRAKVGDFGLVRLAPEGKGSVETRIAGTFGYLAPEYAITGRVTTKVDVFSFGVILMELITGRKALDESQPEESMHLVTWFRRIHLNKDTFRKSIDQALDVTEENLASIIKAAELAGHCCAREPYQRPDMSHAVNVLSSLVEMWKPSDQSCDDMYGIDLDLSLPQALKKWQAFEGGNNSHTMDASSSSFLPSLDNTQTSIPNRPYGFAESFGVSDGR